eukprot:6473871-Prymnesium_polylepis.2
MNYNSVGRTAIWGLSYKDSAPRAAPAVAPRTPTHEPRLTAACRAVSRYATGCLRDPAPAMTASRDFARRPPALGDVQSPCTSPLHRRLSMQRLRILWTGGRDPSRSAALWYSGSDGHGKRDIPPRASTNRLRVCA